MFFVLCLFLSSLVWLFLWLPEEVLTLLFLLHREDGVVSILMKVIFEYMKVWGSRLCNFVDHIT